MTQQNKKSNNNKASSSKARPNPNNNNNNNKQTQIVMMNGRNFTAVELRLPPGVKITKVEIDSENKKSGSYFRKRKFPRSIINKEVNVRNGQILTLCEIMKACVLKYPTKAVGKILITLSNGIVLEFKVDLLVLPKGQARKSSARHSEVNAIRVTRNNVKKTVWTYDGKTEVFKWIDEDYTSDDDSSDSEEEYDDNVESEEEDEEDDQDEEDEGDEEDFVDQTKEPNRKKRKNDGAFACANIHPPPALVSKIANQNSHFPFMHENNFISQMFKPAFPPAHVNSSDSVSNFDAFKANHLISPNPQKRKQPTSNNSSMVPSNSSPNFIASTNSVPRTKKAKNVASSSTDVSNADSSNIFDPNIVPVNPIHFEFPVNNTFSTASTSIPQMHTNTHHIHNNTILSADVTNQTQNFSFGTMEDDMDIYQILSPGTDNTENNQCQQEDQFDKNWVESESSFMNASDFGVEDENAIFFTLYND